MRCGQFGADRAHVRKPEPHGRPAVVLALSTGWFQHRTICAGVQVWPAHLDTVASGVQDQGLGGPETHWLAVEQAGQKSGRVVQFEPCRGINEVSEANRMALGETEIGKGGHLFPDPVGDLTGGAPLGHA